MTDEPMDIEAITVALAPLMRRAKGIRATMEANVCAFDAELVAMQQRHNAIQQSEQMKLDSLMREIERLGRMRIEYEGDRRSVVLLYGQIGTRRQPTKVEIEDQERVETWLMAETPYNPIKPVERTINKRALLKIIEERGNVPGAKLVLGEDKFFFDEKVTDNLEDDDARDH